MEKLIYALLKRGAIKLLSTNTLLPIISTLLSIIIKKKTAVNSYLQKKLLNTKNAQYVNR